MLLNLQRAEDSQEITQDDSPPLAEWSNSAKMETPPTADASTKPEKYVWIKVTWLICPFERKLFFFARQSIMQMR